MNTTSHPLTTWWLVRNRRHAALCAFANVVPDLPYFAALVVGLARALPAIVLGLAAHRGIRGELFSVISSAWSTPWANFLAQKLLHNLVLSTAFALVAWSSGNDRAKAISLGWMLHVWVDLSMHVNDAYSVLWPFTLRVFPAPVSYWDIEHHGNIMGWILSLLAAALWALSAIRAWRSRKTHGRGRIVFAAAFWFLCLIALASIAGSMYEIPRGHSARWIDDGIDWPKDLVPIAAGLATGSPADTLAALAALPPAPDTPGALPWEVHHAPARRALLRGYALDLAGRRDEAITTYYEAEALEPVGNIGDKARRYEGEPFRNINDPVVSFPWIGLFLWGLSASALQLARLPRKAEP